jgi:hypothetical protein
MNKDLSNLIRRRDELQQQIDEMKEREACQYHEALTALSFEVGEWFDLRADIFTRRDSRKNWEYIEIGKVGGDPIVGMGLGFEDSLHGRPGIAVTIESMVTGLKVDFNQPPHPNAVIRLIEELLPAENKAS